MMKLLIEGIKLVNQFDGEYPTRFENELFEYLSMDQKIFRAHKLFENPIMTKKYFIKLTDKFRSPHIWMIKNGKWQLRKTIYND